MTERVIYVLENGVRLMDLASRIEDWLLKHWGLERVILENEILRAIQEKSQMEFQMQRYLRKEYLENPDFDEGIAGVNDFAPQWTQAVDIILGVRKIGIDGICAGGVVCLEGMIEKVVTKGQNVAHCPVMAGSRVKIAYDYNKGVGVVLWAGGYVMTPAHAMPELPFESTEDMRRIRTFSYERTYVSYVKLSGLPEIIWQSNLFYEFYPQFYTDKLYKTYLLSEVYGKCEKNTVERG